MPLKTAFITGASGGIGSATALKFLENGYFVIAQYNSSTDGIKNLISVAKEKEFSDYLFTIQCDFSKTDSVKNMLEVVCKSFKRIDVLVNNAGVGAYKLITETTEEEWDKLFNVNVKSVYMITNAVLNGMISFKRGKIINVSSIWGKAGASMEVAYSASKAAVIGYTKALAKEVSPSGITVNCVCPGVIDTKMNARFSLSEMDELKAGTPLGRLGDSREVAELIYFLSSEKAEFITGQILTVDGGFTL